MTTTWLLDQVAVLEQKAMPEAEALSPDFMTGQ
jgi:hypothetical protein